MKKILKFLVLLLLLAVCAGGFLVWGGVPESQQLKALPASQSVTEVVDFSKAKISFSEQGMTTSLTLTSQQFAQFVKLSLAGNPESDNLALDLVGNDIRLQMPVSLGFIPSRIVILGEPSLVDQELHIKVTSTKLGNLPVPKALFLSQVQERAGSSLTVQGDTIKFPLTLPAVQLNQIQVIDGQMTVHLVLNGSGLASLLGAGN